MGKTMKILLTAFDPFGGESVNPAEEAVKGVSAPAGVELTKLTVPTVYGKSIETVVAAMESADYDAVLCIGQAGGRSDLTVERVAINVNDAAAPDNAGVLLTDAPIAEDGPAAYFATLPVKAMVEGIRKVGIPASLSNTAGTFVCNQLLYGVLHSIAVAGKTTRAGFIHVPFIPAQVVDKAGKPSMALETIIRGIEAALATIAE